MEGSFLKNSFRVITLIYYTNAILEEVPGDMPNLFLQVDGGKEGTDGITTPRNYLTPRKN